MATTELGILFHDMAIMIGFALLAYLISNKIKQPSSIIIIIFGILIGPSLLGLVHYNSAIHIIARLGSVFLLFLAGLATDFGEIYNKRSLMIGVAGGILPFFGGFIIGILFGFDLPTSIFIGAALTATCLGLTTAVLKEIGKLGTEPARLIFGAAVVDDVVGLTILSIAITVPVGISFLGIGTTVFLSIAFIALSTLLGARIIPSILDSFDRYTGMMNPKLTFMLGIGIVLTFAYFAEFIGLAAIVGAFLAGGSMSKSLSARFLHHGGEFLEAIFAPMFLISIGIATEMSSFSTMLPFIIVLSIVAIMTKLIGCGYTAMKCGMSKKDSIIVGIGMAPRGEVAFIIALYGLSLNIIGKEVYSAIVLVSFITTVFSLIALKKIYEK